MQETKKAENKHSKRQENLYKGNFSALYVIMEVLRNSLYINFPVSLNACFLLFWFLACYTLML